MSAVAVRELDLDLDAFEGPFDLLLTLILKEELSLADVQVVEIIVAFLDERNDAGMSPTDLELCGEFLVLVSALLELKARVLFAEDEELELEDLDPEEAAAELAERLAEYRRIKAGATWFEERLDAEADRFFRIGPAPLAPAPAHPFAPQEPERLAAAIRVLATPPPAPSLTHLALRFPPVSLFLERFRAVLKRRRRFLFDDEVDGMSRVEQAVAFLALLELCKAGEIRLAQTAAFEPITVSAGSGSGCLLR